MHPDCLALILRLIKHSRYYKTVMQSTSLSTYINRET